MPEVIDFPTEVRIGYAPFNLIEPLFEAFGLVMVYLSDLVRVFAERPGNNSIFFVHGTVSVYVPGEMRAVDQGYISGLHNTFHVLIGGKIIWQRLGVILHNESLRH